jgi:uncharacterized protein
MDEQQNLAFIKKMHEDFQRGDMGSYLAAFDENVEWQLPETEHIPYAGIHKGRKEFQQFLNKLLETQVVVEYEPYEFISKGNKVIVMGTFIGRNKATGEEFDLNWIHIYTIGDGKIVNFREYMDTSNKMELLHSKGHTA